jgi:hypothetical protein
MTGLVRLTAVGLLLTACSQEEEVSGRRIQDLPELPVSIELDEAATIRFDDPGKDFVLVHVTYNAQRFGIYAGNNPSTPNDPAVSEDISREIGARYPVYCVRSDSEQGESGHCLVDLRAKLNYPWYLYFFYNDFAPETVDEVMAVIASTRVLESEGL